MSASMIPGKKITATDIIERMDYRGKKYIILSFVFTVLGVIVGLFFLMIMLGLIFDVQARCYPLVVVLSFLSSGVILFSQCFLIISTIRYRRDKEYRMPVLPVTACVSAGFIIFFIVSNLNSVIQERFILPNADKIENIPTGVSEDFSHFDVSIWDFETVLRYKLHEKGYDSGRIDDYDGEEKGYDYVIHLDNGDDILISSYEDDENEISLLAGMKYVINTQLTADNAELPCDAFVSVIAEKFIMPYDREAGDHLLELNYEYRKELADEKEGSFVCDHLSFSYEVIDLSVDVHPYAIGIVATPEI